MLYHFSNIDFFEFALYYTSLFNDKDVIVLDKSIVYRINYPEDIKMLKKLKSISQSTQTTLIVACKLITNDIFNVVIVFYKGSLVGITKQAYNTIYKPGDTLDVYNIENKKYAILLNEDIYIPQIDSYINKFNPDVLLHIDEKYSSIDKCIIAANMSIKNNIKVYSLFSDGSIFYGKDGSFKQIEIGTMRRMKYFKSS